MRTIELQLPEEIPDALAKFTLAAELYEKALVSQGQAAEIAGVSRAEFLELLGRAGRSFTNISPDDLAEELDAWRQLPSRTVRP